MITVIGSGAMGSVIAGELSKDYDVTVIDRSREALGRLTGVKTFLGDAFDFPGLKSSQVVVTALPSPSAQPVVERLLKSGMKVVDISFTDYDPFKLDGIARVSGGLLVPHAGFAPGLSNILAGKLYYEDNSREIEILVGGLQEEPLPPMYYAPTFNASSVIDEYTRPARYLEKGKLLTAEPLETVANVNISTIGPLESFYSDGLSTILTTFENACVIEKTLRYPGHLEKMKFLRDMGYFGTRELGGCVPRILSDEIFRTLAGEYRDLSILVVRERDQQHIEFRCIDHYDEGGKVTSMGRMTGYTAASIVRGIMEGFLQETGVYAVEWIGRSRGFYDFILKTLLHHGIKIEKSLSRI